MPDQSETATSIQNLTKLYSDFNALKIRLDTTGLLQQIEYFLRGAKYIVEQTKDEEIKTKLITMGVPKANDDGIQSILNWVQATINPHTVQGNFPADNAGISQKYDAYIAEYHIELTSLLIINVYNWDLNDDEIDGIIEFIMLLIIPFMSRLIDNKERESYGETFKTLETSILKAKGGVPLVQK